MSKLSVHNQTGDNMHVNSNHLEYVKNVNYPVIVMNGNKIEAYDTKGIDISGTWMSYVLNKHHMVY